MSVTDFKTKGNAAFKVQNYTEAITNYTKAIDIDPASTEAGALYSNRAACFTSLNQLDKALLDADSCIRVRPDWLKGYFRKGVALEKLSRFDEALRAFQDALKTDAGNAEVQEKLQAINSAIKSRNDKATPEAAKTADEAKSVGNSLFGQGKYEVAAAFYGRAIELYEKESSQTSDPVAKKTANVNRANCYANRAACHQQTHSYKQVIMDCEEALLIDEKHVKALIRRAIAYEGLEKWQKAMDDYTAVNMLSPGMSNVSQGVTRCRRALN